MKDTKDIKYILGVDEVGRGPLAGPVTVCAALFPYDYNLQAFIDENSAQYKIKCTDSKGLKEKDRVLWNEILNKNSGFKCSIQNMSSELIDRLGIAVCIKELVGQALEDVLNQVNADPDQNCTPENCRVYLDGGLYAPKEFLNQSTHIKGDVDFPIISFASIKAKVHRDAFMTAISEKFPGYGFEVHKGYGTKKHCDFMHSNGLCEIHRISFCKNFQN